MGPATHPGGTRPARPRGCRAHRRQVHAPSLASALADLARVSARQILQTFPGETAPRYMLRDRDAIYGESFTRCIASMGIREVLIAPRAPWQNAFVERVIGSIRRECLDHVIILSEAHLCRVLRAYLAYYNTTRPHQSLDNNSPHPRVVERHPCSRIIAIPQVGGLHHRYQRVA